MKLYIKQRIFSIGDKYNIYNQNEELVYHVQSQFFSIGAKMFLKDRGERELYFIKQKLTLFLNKYEIYKGNKRCATIEQKLSFLKSRLTIQTDEGSFDVEGNLWDMDYEIRKNGKYFGAVHKAWLAWGDSYELDIAEGDDPAFFAAVVVAIDHCLHNENHND